MPLLREPLPYDEGCAPISSTIFSCERIGPCIQDRTLSMRRRFSSRLVVQEFAARCGGLLTIAFSVFHAHFKSVRAQRPAVAEDDGLSCSPVIEIDLRSILSSKRAHGASLLVGFVKSDGPLYRKNRADVRTGCRIYGFPFPPLRASDFAFHLLNLMAGTF